MAELVSTLATEVSTTARDPNQTATSLANVISLLSYSQQVVNGVLSEVTASASLALTPLQNIYPLFTNLPAAVRVLAIRDASGRDLVPFPDFASLRQVDTNWAIATSDAPRSWAMCGRDLLIVYPGVRVAQTLTVIYSKLTTTLTGGGDTTEVTNDDDDAVQDLTEVMLLLKARDLPDCQKIIERFKNRIAAIRSQER